MSLKFEMLPNLVHRLLNPANPAIGWQNLLRYDFIDSPNTRKDRFLAVNSIIASVQLLILTRLGLLPLLDIDKKYHAAYSTSLIAVGKSHKLVALADLIAGCSCSLHRYILIYLITKRSDIIFLDTVIRALRDERKRTMVKHLYKLAVVGCFAFVFNLICFFTGLLIVNSIRADSLTDQLWWIFWYPLDLIVVSSSAIDEVLFLIVWIVVVVDFNCDCDSLDQSFKSDPSIDHIVRTFSKLVAKTLRFQRLMEYFLTLNVITDYFLVALICYTVSNSDTSLVAIMICVACVILTLIKCMQLAFAAFTCTYSLRLYQSCCCRSVKATRDGTSVRDRMKLLFMMESLASNKCFIPLRTLDDEKYDSKRLLLFLIETALNYTLLVTFERFIPMQ